MDTTTGDAKANEAENSSSKVVPSTVALNKYQVKQFIEVASSAKYRNRPVPENLRSELGERIADFVYIPDLSRSNLIGMYPAGADAMDYLQADWAEALASGAMYLYDDKVNFATRMRLTDGNVATVVIVKSNNPEPSFHGYKPWIMIYVPSPWSIARGGEVPEPVASTRAGIEAKPVPTIETGKQSLEEGPCAAVPKQRLDAILAMRRKKNYLKGQVPTELYKEFEAFDGPLFSFAILTTGAQKAILDSAGENIDVPALLNRDFKTALDNHVMRRYNETVFFPISVLRADGRTPLEVAMKPNSPHDGPIAENGSRWVIAYVDSYVKYELDAGLELENWAIISSWADLLDKLVTTALPEMWDFEYPGAETKCAHSILKSYLVYTYYRLKREGKILEDANAGFAAFNTGLVTKLYEPIFACFSNSGVKLPAWRFEGFCIPGSHSLGKQLVRSFNPLPERAEYFLRKEDLLYDTDQPLELDTQHILLDNIDRLPLEFLNDELGSCEEAQQILSQVAKTTDILERSRLFGDLREIVTDNPKLQRRLMNRLNDAKELALKRVEWNFRTAVPAFYPTRNAMSLLLPLDLTEDERPDVALVVELTESGAYLGQTIFSMQMAYQDARLVCRPDSDWLNTSIKQADSDEMSNVME